MTYFGNQDGCWSTIERSCMVVQDLTDFCFHSYFSYMDELRENLPPDEKPLDVRLSLLPSCLLVIMVGVPVDVILITSIAIWKSPYMLFRGWKRLLEDLIGREGPFSETMCVPFAGIAIILWPLAVVGAILAACLSSLFLGLYSGLVVHQEDSIKMGFAYIVSVVSLFDEYVNDLLYLREGSCLPRPKYRKKMAMIQTHEQNNFGENDGDNMKCKMEVNPIHEYRSFGHNDNNDTKYKSDNTQNSRFISQQTRNLKGKFQQYRPVQVWDWLFRSCEINGRILLRDGVISFKDVEECLMKGNCKTLTIKLPAWTILHCLLTSAKSNSDGLVISDDIELTRMNKPRDKVFEWFYGPLLIMKEQLKNLELKEWEEICLKELALKYKNEIPEEWDGSEFQSNDNVRRAQLQAIIRRLQGIVVSLSRIPTFCRRIRNLVKVLYIEALHARASGSHIGGHVSTKYSGNISIESTNADLDKSSSNVNHRACQDENLV